MQNKAMGKIPVILDTDIGTDIDDVWALIMMLNSPELEVKLVLTACGNTTYKAKIVAKLLEVAGRVDIPVGLGLHTSDEIEAQGPWVEDYDLETYPGIIHRDGVTALNEMILNSNEEITVISIGPLTNIAAALEREPKIVNNAKYVGMQGSIRVGYGRSTEISAEYNVMADISASQKVFSAPWKMTITPMDSSGLIHLNEEEYLQVHTAKSELTKALIENYRIWDMNWTGNRRTKGYGIESTTLYDTVAIYLAFSTEMLHMEELGIRVDDDGYTLIDDNAKKVYCATAWKDIEQFKEMIIKRVTGSL